VAYRCDVCGKGSMRGHSVSHAHNLTLRRWYPNLQRVRALVNGQVSVIRACTECLRGGKVQKAPRGRAKLPA
jgi:large subunit ribosomal protein L28